MGQKNLMQQNWRTLSTGLRFLHGHYMRAVTCFFGPQVLFGHQAAGTIYSRIQGETNNLLCFYIEDVAVTYHGCVNYSEYDGHELAPSWGVRRMHLYTWVQIYMPKDTVCHSNMDKFDFSTT
jgi:hypothetical protein